MKDFKNLIYAVTCLSLNIIIGAAVFEHLVVWPTAYAAPPASLSMFQGEYGFKAVLFWSKIHPVTLLLFVITLVTFWKTERRNHILIPFVGYFIILIITSIYFVPELIDIVETEYSARIDEQLVSRGSLWIKLSLVRLFVLIGLAIFLFLGLTQSKKAA